MVPVQQVLTLREKKDISMKTKAPLKAFPYSEICTSDHVTPEARTRALSDNRGQDACGAMIYNTERGDKGWISPKNYRSLIRSVIGRIMDCTRSIVFLQHNRDVRAPVGNG